MTDLLRELDPVVAPVECSGQRHRIRWEAGELAALDHDDPEGERALVALGGPSCSCLDVLDAWSRRRAGTLLLTGLSRGIRDPIQPQPVGGGPGYPGPPGATARAVAGRHAIRGPVRLGGVASTVQVLASGQGVPGMPPATPGLEAAGDLVALATLGYPMTCRLVATVTASHLTTGGELLDAAARSALTASLFGRAGAAMRDWLGLPDLDLDLDLTVIDAAAQPRVALGSSGHVRADLPLGWVASVWGRDLTVVAGRFCLAVIESAPSRTVLLSAGPDFSGVRPLVIELQ